MGSIEQPFLSSLEPFAVNIRVVHGMEDDTPPDDIGMPVPPETFSAIENIL